MCRYHGATSQQQTACRPLPRMQPMDKLQDLVEEHEMNDKNIHQFLEAARQYLLGFMPAQPQLATIPVRTSR